MNEFMECAIREGYAGILKKHGGPFGAVVVKDNKIVAKGHNRVLLNNDPTCHGEIDAIRKACKVLKTYDLSGCDLYTTGEPCPMCLSACLWANINRIYYGCTINDNEKIGFRDEDFYEYLNISLKNIKNKIAQINRDECLKLFEVYNKQKDKIIY